MKINKINIFGQLLLFFATILWGTSFFILKETIEQVPTFYVLAIRFFLSGILLGLIFIKSVMRIKRGTVVRGLILGFVLTCAYTVQTIGLGFTTPSRNAFLTASYCVLTPFLFWFITKKRPELYSFISAFLCIVGIGLVAFSSGSSKGDYLLGDALTLGGAVFYALQIIFIDLFQKNNDDTIQLLVSELLSAGIFFILMTLIFEVPNSSYSFALNLEQILKIGYLTVMCTLVAQMAMIFGQKYTSASQASLILSLEAVFGTLFSVMFWGEKLTLMLLFGFIIIFIAMIINELKLDPLKLLNRKKTI